MNPYEVLGVSSLDGEEVVKSKYRELCKRYHPDNPDTANVVRFREVVAAWKMLKGNLATKGNFRWTHGSSVFDILKKEV